MKSNYNLNDYLSIHLSKRCNLHCPHCYQRTYNSKVVDIEDIKKAVKIFNPTWLVLYGGEPMVEQDTIRKIFQVFPNKKFLMYTNGTIWNEEIFNRIDKIVVTVESFIYEEAVKYRPMTRRQHEKSIELVRKYKGKTEILHNIYPMSHDKYFYRMARLLGVKVQSYPIILDSDEFKFDASMIEAPLFREMTPNTLPKMRLLEDGTLTRDMRGIYNICHVDEWNEDKDYELPISEKCLACKYLNHCPASSIFPHFVHDVLKNRESAHFCELTKSFYEPKHVFFEITDLCNENCSHCDKKWRTDCGHTADKAMLDKVLSIPKSSFMLSGGEPGMAREKVKYIIEHSNTRVAMNTNLTLWQDEDFEMFRIYDTFLSISVVSLEEDTYQQITGKNLVHVLKRNLDKVNPGMARITIVINDYNIKEIDSMVEYLSGKGFKSYIIQPAIPGEGDKFDYDKYLQRLAALKSTIDSHRDINIQRMCHYDASYDDLPVSHLCDAGVGRIGILSNGDAVPCNCMPPVVLGNIMHDSWATIQKNGELYYNSFNDAERIACKGFLSDDTARKMRR